MLVLKTQSKLLIALAVIAIVTILFAPRAEAATLTLSGGCSIDNAILSANNDADTGGCVGTGTYGDDTINIPSGTWSLGLAQVTSNIVFAGSGIASTILDGGGTAPGLECNGQFGGPYALTIRDMNIMDTGPNSGSFPIAAANCNLTVERVELTGWQDTAAVYIDSEGIAVDVAMQDVYIHDGIGTGISMIENHHEVTATDISAELNNVTITNIVPISGPTIGLLAQVDQGEENSITVNMSNSTLTNPGNDFVAVFATTQSGSVGVNHAATINLFNTTITRTQNSSPFAPVSGVAVFAAADPGANATSLVSLRNVLLADNEPNATCLAMTQGSGGNESAMITSLGNNITDDASCNLTASGDQQNVSGLAATLGPLQNNGGLTPTIALLQNSPAIDAGATIGGITVDQRGIARPQCSTYDVGAYEYDDTCPLALENSTTPSPSPSVAVPQQLVLANTGASVMRYLLVISGLLVVGTSLTLAWRKL